MRRQAQRERQVRHDHFYDYGARSTVTAEWQSEPGKPAVASRLKQISELVGGAVAVATTVGDLLAALL